MNGLKLQVFALYFKRMNLVLVSLVLAAGALSASAQISKWVDDNGKTHYGSSPPADHDVETIKKATQSTGSTAGVTSVDVILYSTSWCGYCKQARAYMTRNQIDYKEYDIENSLSAKRDYDRLGGKGGVPYLVKGDNKVAGFSQQSYDRFFAVSDN